MITKKELEGKKEARELHERPGSIENESRY